MIKCLLVAVSEYAREELNLPYCKSDLIKIRSSLINGLKADESHIDSYQYPSSSAKSLPLLYG